MVKHINIVLFVILFLFIAAPTCNAIGKNVVALATKALEVTDSFDKPIIGGNVKRAEKLYNEYKNIYEELQKFLQNPPKNTWNSELDCISYASSIVNIRRFVLFDYIIASEAYQNGQSEQGEEMIATMYKEWNEANSMRQDFYDTYGF